MALRFIGFGAAKCATTWTYRVLKRHPEVVFPAGKEVNFWTDPDPQRLEWYSRTMADDDRSIVAGDISPHYALLSRAKIRAIHDAYPDVRLLFNVRQPVDRLWSRAKHLIRDSGLDLQHLSLPDLGPFVFVKANFRIGDYAAVLDRWLSVFPRDQVLVSQFEELVSDPGSYFLRVCEHIGIDPAPLMDDRAQHHRRRGRPDRPMPAAYRHVYEQMYVEPMVRFRDRYGIDYTETLRRS